MSLENNHTDEVSLKELILKTKESIRYLFSNWFKIGIVGIIGAALGFFWALYTPWQFKAKVSFVVEEGKSGGSLSSLAGQFGLDLGGVGGVSLLYGENLLIFLKSENLTKEVLLSPYDSAKNYSLADKYAEVYKLRKRWANSKKIGREVFFPSRTSLPYTRLQDSLVDLMTEGILKKQLFIERPEKKATFVNVATMMQEELLSKYYCERLVEKAINRYIQSKTARQQRNVDRLQRRADSIAAVLNNKTFVTASEQEKILDVNPAARTATVNAEVSSRDKMMLGTIYGEVVKNLEIAKVQLNQETPTIQMVDTADLPLNIVKKSKLMHLLIGGILGGLITVIALLGKKMLKGEANPKEQQLVV